MTTIFIFAISMVIVLVNVFVTSRVVNSKAFSVNQKIVLYVLIWVIPVVGAGIVYSFISSDDGPKGSNKGRFGGGSGNGGIGSESGGD